MKLKKKLQSIFEEIFADVFDDSLEKKAIQDLIMLKKYYSEIDIISSTKNMATNNTNELKYLAIAGYSEVQEDLIAVINSSKDEDDIFSAAIGLAYLNHDKGFEILEQFALKSFCLNQYIDPWSDVLEELVKIPNQKANILLQKYKNGYFGKDERST